MNLFSKKVAAAGIRFRTPTPMLGPRLLVTSCVMLISSIYQHSQRYCHSHHHRNHHHHHHHSAAGTETATHSDDGAEVSAVDAAAAEESTGEDERSDRVESNADRVDGNVDEARIAGRLGAHDDAECD